MTPKPRNLSITSAYIVLIMEDAMTDHDSRTIKVENGGLVGSLWFIGWLFTLAYAQLSFWQAVLGVVAWPYYLGLAVR